MRVAVVDIGTNSTRLLVADVDEDGGVTELERRSTVTRLGEGVEQTGALGEAPMQRVFDTLAAYRTAIDAEGADATTAVLTSAVRDASNGAEFTAAVRERYGLDAHTISGDEEAELTFLGATSERAADAPGGQAEIVVIDIGGGSTEFVVGAAGVVRFHVSTQAGVVRHGERHIHHDPPEPEELQYVADDVRELFAASVPADVRAGVAAGIAVAGTATSAAAIDLALDPYDPAKVHGHHLNEATLEMLLARLAEMTDDQRREVKGLHPDRAPTIVPGMILLLEAIRLFGLDEVEVSEHDILRGAALRRAQRSSAS